MQNRSIRVFEYEKLTLQKDERGRSLQPKELQKLYDFNDKNGNVYFTGIRDGIKFNSYVGVIQIGGLTIEILPKTDNHKPTKQEFTDWHGALLNMLKVCRFISVSSVSEASLKRKFNSILDLYFEMYLNELETLVRQGLIMSYRKQSGNVTALKGRIEFSKNIQKNLIHKERFYTNHQVYDSNHLLNQVLFEGLKVLKVLTTNSMVKDRVARLTALFPELDAIKIEHGHFGRLKESRKTASYSQALQIAKMLILNYSPDIRSGQENMLTLLFDMNKLWEEYIYRMLARETDVNTKISFQNQKGFWETRSIRPDLVVSIGKQDYVIDTKWKRLDTSNPDPSMDDLRQMFAYNHYWKSKRSMLLYPNSMPVKESFGSFWQQDLKDEENQCKVAFIHVLNDQNQLDYEIGKRILEKLGIASHV